jgi:O-antigen/teichoic acid export membrane protein
MALVSSVCTVLVPATAEATARGDRKRLRRLADKSVRTVGMLGLPLTAILVPLAPTLSRLFFGQTVTVQTVAALGAACILSDYQAVFGSMLNGLGCQKRLVAASVCGECVQLAMLYVLCARPALGVNGYLIALLVGALCTAALEAGMLRGLGLPMLCFDRLRDPLLVGITLLFWTRALYWGMLSLLGGQFQAVVLTLCASGLLFCACLTALGYPVRRYLSVYRGKIPINSFFLC